MFFVHDTFEERKTMIQKFARQEPCVGVLLAAANFEWTFRRCIFAMGKDATKKLREQFEKEKICSERDYRSIWREQIASQNNRL